MDNEGENETQLDDFDFTTPLGSLAEELHEISVELKHAGFSDPMIAQIIAYTIVDAISNRPGADSDEDEDDEYDADEDDLDNEPDS